jgi:NitT/TauT family transport system substrate-binding protein
VVAAKAHIIDSYSSIAPTVGAVWVAKEGGFFEKHGVDVDQQYIASTTSVNALIAGQVQVAAVGGSEVFGAIAGGADLVFITVDTPVYPYLFEVAPGINSIADLKGKSIGISRFGSSSDLATRMVLKTNGIDPDKGVTYIQAGSTSERMAAMDAGTIQAGVDQPPDTLTLEQKGWHSILDLASQSNLLTATLSHVVRRAYRDANRDVVQRYVDGLVDGIARWRKDRAYSQQILQKYLKNDDPKLLAASYDYAVRPELTPTYPYPRPEQFADTIAVLGPKNDRLTKLDVAAYLDPSFVKSAEDRGIGK